MAKFKVGDHAVLTGSYWGTYESPRQGSVVEIIKLDSAGYGMFNSADGDEWVIFEEGSLAEEWGANLLPTPDNSPSPSSGETRLTSSTGGQKGSKIERYDLIPPEPLKLLAELYGRGAEKYDDNNWRKGYDWKLSFASMQRHEWDFWNGVDIDEETGVPNLINAAWHCFTLVQFMIDHPEFDSRKIRDEVAGRSKDADNQDQ